MKKIISICILCSVFCILNAAERTVWEGNIAISWDNTKYIGLQFDTHDYGDIFFPDMKAEDTIRVSISDIEENAQFVLGYKAGNDWTWTDLEGTVVEGDSVIIYPIATDGIATLIKERGLIVKGIYFHARRIVVRTAATTPEPIDPEDPTGEYEFTDVWTGDKAISWNTEVYAGEQFDTYVLQQDMFAGIAKDDSIKVYYAQAISGAQFAASYKAGDNWDWTDLAIVEKDGFYAYRVADEQMAQWIADRGIVLRGQGYHAVRIVVGKPKSASGIVTVNGERLSVKVIRNGQLFILRNGVIYTVNGQIVR